MTTTSTRSDRPGHPIADLVGPCHESSALAEFLGVSVQELTEQSRAGELLACRTSDGTWVYPAFQFDADGQLLPHLADLIAILTAPGAGEDRRWRTAQWLAAPSPDLPEHVSAAAWLRAGGDPGPVLMAARADAARWAA